MPVKFASVSFAPNLPTRSLHKGMNVKKDNAEVPDYDAVGSSRTIQVRLTGKQYEDLVELAHQTQTTLAELLGMAFAEYIPLEIERLKQAGTWRGDQRSKEASPTTPPIMPPSSEVN